MAYVRLVRANCNVTARLPVNFSKGDGNECAHVFTNANRNKQVCNSNLINLYLPCFVVLGFTCRRAQGVNVTFIGIS